MAQSEKTVKSSELTYKGHCAIIPVRGCGDVTMPGLLTGRSASLGGEFQPSGTPCLKKQADSTVEGRYLKLSSSLHMHTRTHVHLHTCEHRHTYITHSVF